MAVMLLTASTIRCSPAEMFDMRLNSHSRLNLITALLEAIRAGADEAVMLDPGGHVSSCNANFNLLLGRERRSTVRTSTGGLLLQRRDSRQRRHSALLQGERHSRSP